MEDLKRIRVITAQYHSLQGLRALPFLIWALLINITEAGEVMGIRGMGLDYRCLLVVPGLGVVWALSRWIGKYYERAFGRVEELPSRHRSLEWLATVLFGIIVLISIWVDGLLRLPVIVTSLVLAAAMVYFWWTSHRFLTHYLVLAAFLVGLALLPLMGVPIDGRWYDHFVSYVLILGVFIVVCVLNHIALLRNVKALSQVEL
jgi:hypothetical protein